MLGFLCFLGLCSRIGLLLLAMGVGSLLDGLGALG